MPPRGPHPATVRPRPQLPQARLVLGAAAAALGLFVAFHWIVLPGDKVSLDQMSRGTESVATLDPATRAGFRRSAVAHNTVSRLAPRGGAVAAKAGTHPAKPVSGGAGKPVGASPATKEPGAPAAGGPGASGGDSPGATETPAGQSSSSPPPPPSPPPSPPSRPAGLPQVPQLPQAPQVPVPTVPDLAKPQVPSVPTPPVPTLP
jgi:hypothetical protein